MATEHRTVNTHHPAPEAGAHAALAHPRVHPLTHSPTITRHLAAPLLLAWALTLTLPAHAVFQSYDIQILPGFNYIANHLDNGGNSLDEIMPDMPEGTEFFKWDKVNRTFTQPATYFGGFWFGSDPATLTLAPGEGGVLNNLTAPPYTLTFSGQPRLPAFPIDCQPGDLCLLSSQTPAPATYENIVGLPPEEGVMVTRWDPFTQSYTTNTFSAGLWVPFEPVAQVGEALFVERPPSTGGPLTILVQPVSQSAVNCDTVQFVVEAVGTEPLAYQWYRDGIDIPGATDAVLILPSVTFTDAGGYHVVVQDGAGESLASTVAFLDVGNLPPVLSCPPDLIVPVDPGGCTATGVDLGLPTASDECGPVSVSHDAPAVFPLGDTLVTWFASDLQGETTTCQQTVTVTDQTPPRPELCLDPPVQTILGGQDGFVGPEPASPRPELVSALSMQGVILRGYDDLTPGAVFAESWGDLPECLTDVALALVLRAAGPTSQDDTLSLGLAGPSGFAALWTGYLGQPGPAGEPPLIPVPWVEGAQRLLFLDLSRLPVGAEGTMNLIPILAEARSLDLVLGDDTAVDVTVSDVQSCRCLPEIVVPSDPGQAGAVVFFDSPVFTDNCDPAPLVSFAPSPGSFFPLGRTPVQVTAFDAAGNEGRCWFDVVVTDEIPPVLNCPTSLALDCVKPSGAPVFYEVTATDDSGPVEIFCVPPSGSVFPIGTTMVECTAVDASGNVATCSFPVTLTARFLPTVYPVTLAYEEGTLTFPTQPGLDYTVCYKDRLDDPAWLPLTTWDGDGGWASVIDPVPGVSSRFYRVSFQAPPQLGSLTTLYEPPEPPPALPGTVEPERECCGPPHVYLFSGELHHEVEDLRIKGRGLDFVWARKYRSCLCFATPMGWNWDFSYNICIVPNGPNVDLLDGNTRQDTYFQQPDGSYAADMFFREGRFNPDGRFVLTFADRGVWEFLPLDGGPAQGRIDRIADRNGNALRFAYDGSGRLTNVIDTLDRPIAVAYDANGFIESVTDFTGRQVRYTHYQTGEPGGTFGDLRSVTSPAVHDAVHGNSFPEGNITHRYTYTASDPGGLPDHLLLTITDAKGQTWLENTFEPSTGFACSRVVRQVWGYPDQTLHYTYVPQVPSAANLFAVSKAIVNDRVGNVSECCFDAANRPVIHRQFTGRAVSGQFTTDTLNRPVQPLRPEDPAFFETRWEWNLDALPTAVTLPNGNRTEWTYERSVNSGAHRRSFGNIRSMRRLPGPLGGDQPALVERYAYDTESVPGPLAHNRVTRHVDARGHATEHAYNGRGNRLHTRHRLATVTEDWEYNGHGQVTAHVLPDNGSGHRRRDEYGYYEAGPQRGYRAAEVLDAGGVEARTEWEYDEVGNVVRRVDPGGGDWFWIRNELNQVVREISAPVAAGGEVRYRRDFHYDANHNLVRLDVEHRDDQGAQPANGWFTTLWDYEILNHPVRETRERDDAALPAGVLDSEAIPFALRGAFVATEYAYDANRNRTLVRHGEAVAGFDPFNQEQSAYDERDLRFRETRGAGGPLASTTQWDYDGNANARRVRRGLEDAPRTTITAHDGYDRPIAEADPLGNVTAFRYDANGNLLSRRLDGELQDLPGGAGNRRLAQTTFEWDPMDRLVREDRAWFDPQTQAPLGDGSATTQTGYNGLDQVVRVTDDRGLATITDYDGMNRTNAVTDAAGNRTAYEHDAGGRVRLVTTTHLSAAGNPPLVLAVTNAYDGLGRMVETADAAGRKRYAHDSRGLVTRVEDPRGNVTRLEYDGLGRRIATRLTLTDTGDGQGNVVGEIHTHQVWDDSSRLIAQVDDNDHATRYAYDALDRLIATRHADGTLHLRGAGPLDWPDGAARPQVDEFFLNGHDAHGNLVIETDANGTVVTTGYDLLDRPFTRFIDHAPGVAGATFEIHQYDGASRTVLARNDLVLTTRAWDSLGHLLREGLNFEAPAFPPGSDKITTWDRDALGNAVRTRYPGGREVGRTFEALSRVRRICEGDCLVPAPAYPAVGSTLVEYFRLGPDRVELVQWANGAERTTLFDAAGRPVDILHGDVATGRVLDRRLRVWDAAGHAVWEADGRGGGLGLEESRAFDSADRLILTLVTNAAGGLERSSVYTLDGVGNRLQVSSDPAPGLYVLSATTPDPADAQVNQYTSTPFDAGRQYDANGNLVAVNGAVWAYDYHNRLVSVQATGSDPVAYAYDALGRGVSQTVGAVVTRLLVEGGDVVEEQDAAGTTLTTRVPGGGDERTAVVRQAGADRFPVHDENGTVWALSDASGFVVERYDYGDAGEPVITSHVQAADGLNGYFSDADPGQVLADDFMFPRATRLLGLRWWGSYGFGPAPASDQFTLRLRADNGGLPGAVLSSVQVGNGVRRLATGRTLTAGVAEYVYETALPAPFDAQPGVRYWLELFNDTTGEAADWGWSQAVQGNTDFASSLDGGGTWTAEVLDAAFAWFTTESPAGRPSLFRGWTYEGETGTYNLGGRPWDPLAGRFLTRDPRGAWADPRDRGNGHGWPAPPSVTDPGKGVP